MVVEITEVDLGRGIAAFCAQLEETEGFAHILPNTAAFEVQNSQIVKRRTKSAICRRLQPIERGPGVWFSSPTGQRRNRQVRHRRQVPLARLSRENLVRLFSLLDDRRSRRTIGGHRPGPSPLPVDCFRQFAYTDGLAIRNDQGTQVRRNTGGWGQIHIPLGMAGLGNNEKNKRRKKTPK